MKVHVHCEKEELSVCLVEERIYRLSGETFSRTVDGLFFFAPFRNARFSQLFKKFAIFLAIPSGPYDLILHCLDDHLSPSLTTTPYLHPETAIAYIDPPLVPSYHGNGKVYLLTPLLPLDYDLTQKNLKVFVVNLGVPLGVYEQVGVSYKSFYGDRLVTQVFLKR